ncbi:MAG TPA: DUF1592 domain-containing protein [Planctomycetota bacterium]|nr:DUF1592 domain-containing protein [Planctomycetota bacterium]
MRALTPLLLILAGAAPAFADDLNGQQIYAKKCVSCHGPNGEGTKEHPELLIGDRSLEKLSSYIAKTMPEDKPGTCVGDEAKKVAEYIFNAFYSRAAQARNKPPRIELARLTIGQYRNAIADLIASFREPQKADPRAGLRAEIYNSKRPKDDKRVIDRIDPVVNSTFPATGPADNVAGEEYSGRWTGTLLAPETGIYEINLETINGARLWLNALDTPLIDAWVRSGDEKAHRETVFLLAGRAYPLKFEFFKEKKEKGASVALKWKLVDRVEELIPDVYLSPGKAPETLLLRTAFPPDDRSMGFERGNLVSKAWDEATTEAAMEVALYLVGRSKALAGVAVDAPDAKQRLPAFCRKFTERAFRRPLTPEQVQFFVDRQFTEAKDAETALKKCILLTLKSPRFLYRELGAAEPDQFDTAARISFGAWDSIPDAELFEAAKNGKLGTRDEVLKHVERLLASPRARAKVRQFYFQWLSMDRLHDLTKNAKRFPEFTDEVESDLRRSLDLFLDEVTWSEASDFRQFVLADYVPLNGRLAKFYNAPLPADAPFQKAFEGSGQHAGLLTHPLLMAGFAYDSTTSPIHRGLFVARSLLGRRFRPPPEAVTPLSPDLHPDMTTRERVMLQTKPQACQSCHATINPLGFAFENFDAVGRFRKTELNKPIDATGFYWTRGGDTVKFNGARELGTSLAASEETQAAFIEHLFHFMIKQPVLAHGLDRPESLRLGFVKSGYSIRKLLAEIIASSAIVGARTQGKNP